MTITKADTGESFPTPDARMQEYLRRNEVCAMAHGVVSGLHAIAERLNRSSTPLWLQESLCAEIARAKIVAKEMAAHRDEVGT